MTFLPRLWKWLLKKRYLTCNHFMTLSNQILFWYFSFWRKCKGKRESLRRSKLCSSLTTIENASLRRTTKIYCENVFQRCAKFYLKISWHALKRFFFFQVCHAKKGDINPTKIQKLVKGYVRKYHHSRKKMISNSSWISCYHAFVIHLLIGKFMAPIIILIYVIFWYFGLVRAKLPFCASLSVIFFPL